IAYVPQGREIFGRLTVEENLLMGLSRFSAKEAREVPEFIYELFPVLREMQHRRGGDLSGGQQQQLAIGRALASRPRLLILDEPTEGIQPSVIKEIGAVIQKLAAKGDMAILLVEQFYDFAAELADQYLVMSRGEIVQQGRGGTMEADGVRGLVAIRGQRGRARRRRALSDQVVLTEGRPVMAGQALRGPERPAGKI